MPWESEDEALDPAEKDSDVDKIDKIIEEREKSKEELFGDRGKRKNEEEEEKEEGSLISRTTAVIVVAILILASTVMFLAWDYDGDGLANHEEIMGDSDWMKADTSGDGLEDGTVKEMGLDPAEQHPSVSAAYEGGLRGDNALAFQDIEVEEERLEALASYMAGIDDPYIEDAVDYLSSNPEHIDALVNETGSVQEHAFDHMEELPPEVLKALSPFASEYVDDFEGEDLKRLSKFKDTSTNHSLAENISKVPTDIRDELINYALEETNEEHLYRVRDQAKFLDAMEDKGKLEAVVDKYGVKDFDYTDDGFPNWFSFKESDIIKWDEANDLYGMKFYCEDPDEAGCGRGLSAFNVFVDRIGTIPQDRVIRRVDEDATWDSFKNVTDDLEKRMDGNDILLSALSGHGSEDGTFGFRDIALGYDDIANHLDPIPGYQEIHIDACYAGTALPELKEEDRLTYTSSDAETKSGAGLFLGHYWELFPYDEADVKAFDGRFGEGPWRFDVTVDRDGSGYVSSGEAFEVYRGLHVDRSMVSDEYFKNLREAGLLNKTEEGYVDVDSQNPQVADPSSIADELVYPVRTEDGVLEIDS